MCDGSSDDSASGADESNSYGTEEGGYGSMGTGGIGGMGGMGGMGGVDQGGVSGDISGGGPVAAAVAEIAAASQAAEGAFGGMHTNAQALGDPGGVSPGHMAISRAIKSMFDPIVDINTPLGLNLGPSPAGVIGAMIGAPPGAVAALGAMAEHGIDETAESAVAGQEAGAADAGAGDAGIYDGLMAGYLPGRGIPDISSLMSNTSPANFQPPANFQSDYNPQPRPQWGGLMHPQLEPTQQMFTNPWSAPQEWQWRR